MATQEDGHVLNCVHALHSAINMFAERLSRPGLPAHFLRYWQNHIYHLTSVSQFCAASGDLAKEFMQASACLQHPMLLHHIQSDNT